MRTKLIESLICQTSKGITYLALKIFICQTNFHNYLPQHGEPWHHLFSMVKSICKLIYTVDLV